MSSHPPEHLFTVIALIVAGIFIFAGTLMALFAHWRIHRGVLSGLVHVGMVSIVFAGVLVLINVLIEHDSTVSLL